VRRSHRSTPQRSVWPLLGALVCLLLVAGTSQAAWVTVPDVAFTRRCLLHYRGDCEFAGHGPWVTASADLAVGHLGGRLELALHTDWSETRSDWSAAYLAVPNLSVIYRPPAGQVIRAGDVKNILASVDG